jgi:hypothetical protein
MPVKIEPPLSAIERWMVKSNLQRIEEQKLDLDTIVSALRANGYFRVAEGVKKADLLFPQRAGTEW